MCKNDLDNDIQTLNYKRTREDSFKVANNPSNGWIDLYSQRTLTVYRSGSCISLGIEITMPLNIGAFIVGRQKGVIVTNNLIPPGFNGPLYVDLCLVEDSISGRGYNPDTLLISIVPFAKVIVNVQDVSQRKEQDFEDLIKSCNQGETFLRQKAMVELLERFPDKGKDYIKTQLFETTKNSSTGNWGSFEEAFLLIAPTYFNDNSSLPLLIQIMDNYGTPIKQKVTSIIMIHKTNEVTQALLRAYENTPCWPSSFVDGRKEEIDWEYEKVITLALSQMDSPDVVPALFKALLRGSYAKEKALTAIKRLTTLDNIFAFFKPYLIKEHNWWDLADEARNAQWVLDNLDK